MSATISDRYIVNLAATMSKEEKHFTEAEIECLIREFNVLMGNNATARTEGLDKGKFRNILLSCFGMANDLMMDRVFRTFDKNNDGVVNITEWIAGMSVFLRGTLDEHIKFCFHVYDLTGDNYITREEMLIMLKDSLRELPTEEERVEGVKDLVEMTLKMMDHDRDGRLSFVDFEKAVKKENLLLKAFGPCIPNLNSIETFEKRIFYDQLEH